MARPKSLKNRTQLIVDSARELFGQYGFERTTVEDIARHAGLGKGSIYLEFPTKHDILMAVIREFAESMQKVMHTEISAARPPYLVAMKRILKNHVLAVYHRATSAIHTPEALIHTSRRVRADFLDHFLHIKSCIVELLTKAALNGELSAHTDFDELAELIMLGLSVLCPPYLRNSTICATTIPTREKLCEEADSLLDLLVAGVSKKYGS